jgi:Tfp pilus assembly protein PilO
VKQHKLPIAAGIAVLLIVAIWYVALWGPEGSRLKAARASEVQAVAQVASDQGQLAELQAERPKVAEEKTVLNRLVEGLPNGPSLDQIFGTINKAAEHSGVVLVALQGSAPSGWGVAPGTVSGATATASGPDDIPLSVDVTGTPAHILHFVTALDANPRIYVVTSLTISPMLGVQSVALQVDVFFESSAGQDPTYPGSLTPPTTPPTTAPATAPTTAPATAPTTTATTAASGA